MADKKGNTGVDNTGENNSGNRNSGNWNSGNWNSGNWNSGDGNSGNGNSGDGNSGNRNSGDGNSGNWNSGNWNSGDGNSGNWNSGDGNSGIFNSDEPFMRAFNKPTTVKMSDFVGSDAYPSWDGFDVCVWIPSDIMTAEEKKEYTTHETTGGYVKTLDYKTAWAIFWRKTSEANKKKFLALPNFDQAIFKEITGIDVGQNSEAKVKAKLLRGKADELLKQATDLEASL